MCFCGPQTNKCFRDVKMSRLVTVCMFCLLCAGHALCAAHDFSGATTNLQEKERIPEWRTPGDLASETKDFHSQNYHANEPYLGQDLAYRRRSSLSEGRRLRQDDSAARRAHYLERLNRVRSSQKQTHTSNEAAQKSESPENNVDSIELHKFDQRINDLNELKVEPHSGLGERLGLDGSVSDLTLRVPRSVESDQKSESKELEVKQSRAVRDTNEQSKLEPHVYVKKLFKKFGDDESMTMNMSGFEDLLKHLDLNKLIKETNLLGNDECVYVPELVESAHERRPHSHDHAHDHGHEHATHSNHQHNDELLVDEQTLASICPVLLYQKVSQNEGTDCLQRENGTSDDSEKVMNSDFGAYDKNSALVWLYASLSILVISACGLLGVAVIPIMHKSYYDHLIQFLVALAVGTLCGDALLHLMPHAMAPIDPTQGYNHDDGMWKGLAAMVGVIFFYFCEKVLTVVAEWRKKHQKMEKLPTRVRVMREENNKLENSVNTSCAIKETEHKHSHGNKEDPTTKQCKHKYSEYPYCYDEIRTDTHDDHHVVKDRNSRLSVVSSKALERLAESGADEWLLKGAAAERNGGDKPALEMKTRENDGSGANHTHAHKDEDSYTVILREHSTAHHGHSHSHGHVHSAPRSLGAVAWMVIAGDGLHNFTDGMAVGAAFAGSLAGGFSTALAVLCHELPHELGDFAVLLKAGMSAKRALAYNMLSSALCAMGMAVGVAVGGAPEATQWLFAAAAGMFLYIALVDMMPELSTSHSKEGTVLQCGLQLLGLCCGVGIMLLIATYEHDLKNLFS